MATEKDPLPEWLISTIEDQKVVKLPEITLSNELQATIDACKAEKGGICSDKKCGYIQCDIHPASAHGEALESMHKRMKSTNKAIYQFFVENSANYGSSFKNFKSYNLRDVDMLLCLFKRNEEDLLRTGDVLASIYTFTDEFPTGPGTEALEITTTTLKRLLTESLDRWPHDPLPFSGDKTPFVKIPDDAPHHYDTTTKTVIKSGERQGKIILPKSWAQGRTVVYNPDTAEYRKELRVLVQGGASSVFLPETWVGKTVIAFLVEPPHQPI
jgi:hypothetical protein